jgi:3-deoxy-D-manno-octulosonic-acid transferase
MIILYNIFLTSALLLGFPLWVGISLRRKYRCSILRKLCLYKKGKAEERNCILIHGVSVGEINAAIPFVEKLKKKFPDHSILITSSTVTGFSNASEKLKGCRIEYFPLDLYPVVTRFFTLFPISKIFILETEIWPNFLYTADKLRIPVTIINARISDYSFRKYHFFKKFIIRSLNIPVKIYCQSSLDAKRFLMLGVSPEKTIVLESMKFDAALLAYERFNRKQLPWKKALDKKGGIFFLAGSTQETENTMALDCFLTLKKEYPELHLVLIPRKPETLSSLFPLLKKNSLSYTLRSHWKEEEPFEDILLVDTMGELFDFFSIADMVFIGKSLVPPGGGQNPLEPAVFGKPIVMGERYQNFREIVEEMKKSEAIRIVADKKELIELLKKWLEAPQERDAQGSRAREYIKNKAGTCEKILDGV